MPQFRNEQPVYSREMGLDQKIQYSGGNALYVGKAAPGSATSAAVWQITKYEVDANGNTTSIRLCGGTDDFKWSWDLRADPSYTYTDI